MPFQPETAKLNMVDGDLIAPEPSGGDDTVALNSLLAFSPGKTIRLRTNRTYKISDTLVVPSGTTVEGSGATIDCTPMPNGTFFGERPAFLSVGTTDAGISIANPIGQWTTTVTGITSTATFVPGDLVVIFNAEQPVPGMTRTDRDKGELRIVKSVDSATQLTFATGSLQGYNVASTTIRRINPVENITIRNLKIKMSGTGSRHNGIRVEYGRNIMTENVLIDGAAETAIQYTATWNGAVKGCDIRNSDDGFVGYGIAAMDGSRHLKLSNNQFYNCKHFIAGGGRWPTVFVDVRENHGTYSFGAAYEGHESTFYWKFTGNTAVDVFSGILARGQYITVENNEVVNCETHAYKADTWDHVTEQRGIKFINNVAIRATMGGLWVDGGPDAAGGLVWTDAGYTTDPNGAYKDVNAPCLKIDVEVKGNTFTDCGSNPLLVRHFQGATVENNNVNGSTGSTAHGIYILGLSGTQSNRAIVAGNTIRDTGADGIRYEYVDGITHTGGAINGTTQHGINVQTCNRTNFSGATVRTPGWAGIQIVGGVGHAISTPYISGGGNASYDGVRVSGAAHASVNGGYIASARWAVYTTTTDYVIVSGVDAKDSVQAGKISVDATNKVVVAGSNLV